MTRVHLTLTRGDQDIEIVRSRNPNELSLYEEDGPREISQDDIPRIFGMSEEMLRRTIILGQFGTLFLDLRAEQQAQMFTEALSLDIWLQCVDLAKQETTILERKLLDIESGQHVNNRLLEATEELIKTSKTQSDSFEQDRDDDLNEIDDQIEDQSKAIDGLKKKPIDKPVNPSKKEVDGFQNQLMPIREKRATVVTELKRLDQDLTEAENELNRIKSAKEKTCDKCGQPISNKQHQQIKSDLEDKVKQLTETHKNKADALKKIDEEGGIIRTKKDAAEETYDKALKAYDRKLSDWDAWNRSVTVAESRLADLREKRMDIRERKNTAKETYQTAINKRADLRSKVTNFQTDKKRTEEDIAGTKYWMEAFREIRLAIIDQTLIELEMASARHMGMLGLEDWLIKFDTERESKSGSVSYSFTVLLYPPGRKDAVKWESYSGGESQRIQLAVAFALSEVLLARAGLKPNIEVLDEPTRGLSPQGIEDLLEHLRDRALEHKRAIYLVEHHSLDKGAFDGTLLVTKDKKGSSVKWQ